MALDDHDQLQNDNGEIDVGWDVGLHGNVDKKKERGRQGGVSQSTNAAHFCHKTSKPILVREWYSDAWCDSY